MAFRDYADALQTLDLNDLSSCLDDAYYCGDEAAVCAVLSAIDSQIEQEALCEH